MQEFAAVCALMQKIDSQSLNRYLLIYICILVPFQVDLKLDDVLICHQRATP